MVLVFLSATVLLNFGEALAVAQQHWESTVFQTFDSDIPDNTVRALTTTPDGALWVGTYGGGLARFQKSQWTVFNKAQSQLPDDRVLALTTTPDGALWVGTITACTDTDAILNGAS